MTLTSRPGAQLCYVGGHPTEVQLIDQAGHLMPATWIDPTAAITTNRPNYGWVRLGHGGSGTNEVTTISFTVAWAGSYCGPPPRQLRVFASTWNGAADAPITVTLIQSSSPCGSGAAPDAYGTVRAYPLGGYPLPAAAWASLHASISSLHSNSIPPSFVVRLTNSTAKTIPLRPCFSYAIGIVAHGPDGVGGASFEGSPDCTKLPTTLGPDESIDLLTGPEDLRPAGITKLGDATLTWLMPGGPTVSAPLWKR